MDQQLVGDSTRHVRNRANNGQLEHVCSCTPESDCNVPNTGDALHWRGIGPIYSLESEEGKNGRLPPIIDAQMNSSLPEERFSLHVRTHRGSQRGANDAHRVSSSENSRNAPFCL